MEIHELTDEEMDRMADALLRKMRIERKQLSRQELEKEIIDYLGKKQACCLATASRDGIPRVSVVDYVNDGLTIYIFSEGGRKFRNLKENSQVAIGIGTSARTFRSVRGVNILGTAEIFTEDTREFAHAMKLMRPAFEDVERETGGPLEFPKGMVRIIRVTPTKMVYYHNNRGIFNAHWEA